MKNIDIHEYLIENGYDIWYSTVCNYIKETYAKKEAFIRQEYSLGDVSEFDWGEVKLTIAGKSTTFIWDFLQHRNHLTIMPSSIKIKRWKTF